MRILLSLGVLTAMLIALSPATASAQDTADAAPASEPAAVNMDDVSYAIGVQFALNMAQQGIQLNPDSVAQALRDVAAGGELQMTDAQMNETMQAFITERQRAFEAEQNAFLEANAQKEGVTTLPSGLQYRVIAQGDGPKPTATDRVTTHYRGTLIDGTEFDSSYKRGQPATFPVNGVIPGWTEALQLMPVGSKWELVIPSDLAYGPRGTGNIPGGATLVFEVELLEIAQ